MKAARLETKNSIRQKRAEEFLMMINESDQSIAVVPHWWLVHLNVYWV